MSSAAKTNEEDKDKADGDNSNPEQQQKEQEQPAKEEKPQPKHITDLVGQGQRIQINFFRRVVVRAIRVTIQLTLILTTASGFSQGKNQAYQLQGGLELTLPPIQWEITLQGKHKGNAPFKPKT